jgi:enoyl-CoA hydratase/carnithine racemase
MPQAFVPQIRTETEGGIRWLIGDNPARLNAYTTLMWEALPGLIAEAVADPAVRVVVLTGAGEKAFSAGADISEFEQARSGDEAKRYDRLNNEAFGALMTCSKPVIAMINGLAFGGGCELAICCDLQIAADHAVFSIPAAKLGIGYNPRWIKPLLAAVSPAKAKEMLLTGRRYDAQAALSMGLVGQVVSRADLRAATVALASEIAANAPLSLRAAKLSVDGLAHPDGAVDMAALDAAVDACFASADYVEGRRAFMDKRKAKFVGN